MASIKGTSFSLRISIYNVVFTVPLIKAMGPSILPTKQPQIICDISPSRALGRMFLGSYFSRLFCRRHTHICLGSLFFFTAHSSDHSTRSHCFCVQFRCSLAHLSRFAACILLNNGRFTAFHFRMPAARNRRRRVCSDTLLLVSSRNWARGTLVLDSAARTMYRSSALLVL